MSKKYKVWACKIVVPGDTKLPGNFDSVPRDAAENAIEAALGKGVILGTVSNWGAKLTEYEAAALEYRDPDYTKAPGAAVEAFLEFFDFMAKAPGEFNSDHAEFKRLVEAMRQELEP